MTATGKSLGGFCYVSGGAEVDAGFEPVAFREKGVRAQRLTDDGRV